MAITKSTEITNAPNYPSRRHRSRERKVLETANTYVPTTAGDWTGLAGSPTAPTTQDGALDTLAASLTVVDLKEASGTLTTEELLAMNATPIELIAAPGAGKANIVEEIELFLDFEAAAYAADAGEDLVIRYATSTTAIASWDDADRMVEGTEDERDLVKPTADLDVDDADNEAIEATILSGEWATGDSPLKWRIRYRTVTILA